MPDKIVEEITRLITMTGENKVNWILQQPNNFNFIKWERVIEDKTYLTTIQRQPVPVQVRPGIPTPSVPQNFFYFFTIIKTNPQPQDVLLQLNTQVDILYKTILESLFNHALENAKGAASEILNNLLKDL